ncbi:hypothetical protein [Ruoffia tabacinasalis]|nr:hypothetical protein [Ruoffia tabacinasalis]
MDDYLGKINIYSDTINKWEREMLDELTMKFYSQHKKIYNRFEIYASSYAIFFTNKDHLRFNQKEATSINYKNYLIKLISDQVNKEIDYFRMKDIDYRSLSHLPGLPGIPIYSIQGETPIMEAFVYNHEDDNWYHLMGDIATQYSVGIGSQYEKEDLNNKTSDIEYQVITSNRSDEMYLSLRSAIRRINESFYFNNYSSIFIYLMTTIEALAYKEYRGFKEVRIIIQHIIAKDRQDYDKLADYFKELSKVYRTEVVHNGKDLNDFFNDEEEIQSFLTKLLDIIKEYIIKVYEMNIKSFDDLYIAKNKRNKELHG